MDTPGGQSLHHKDSQATLISLLQLDPSPMDSPSPSAADKESSLPAGQDTASQNEGGNGSIRSGSAAAAGTTSHLGLSSGRSAIYYCPSSQRAVLLSARLT